MDNKLFTPKAAIRVISRQLNEIVLTNFTSFDTFISVSGESRFSITLDFRQALGGFDLVNYLEPNDYIEVFAMRDKDSYGNPDIGFYSLKDLCSFKLFDTWSINGKVYFFYPLDFPKDLSTVVVDFKNGEPIYNGGFLVKRNIYGVAQPLSLPDYEDSSADLTSYERALCPSLIFTGFIGDVSRACLITESGPSNAIVINGRGCEKLLDSSLFLVPSQFLSDVQRAFFSQTVTLPNQSLANTIKTVVHRYLINFYDSLVTFHFASKAEVDSAKEFEGRKSLVTFKKDLNSTPILRYIYNGVLSIGKLLFAQEDTEKPQITDLDGNTLGRISDMHFPFNSFPKEVDIGSIRDMFSIIGNGSLMEYWVDEIGRFVHRSTIAALSQNIFKIVNGQAITNQKDPNFGIDPKFGYSIDFQDIISFKEVKSDKDLLTNIVVEAGAFGLGQLSISQFYGMYPMTRDYFDSVIHYLKGVDSERDSSSESLSGLVKNLTLDSNFSELNSSYSDLISLVHSGSMLVGSMPVTTDDSRVRFWARHIMRSREFIDYWHLNEAIRTTAVEAFRYIVASWRSMSLTVVGRNYYKVGKKVFIPDLNMEYYISAISNRFTFGDTWVTTFTLTNGNLVGDLGGVSSASSVSEEIV